MIQLGEKVKFNSYYQKRDRKFISCDKTGYIAGTRPITIYNGKLKVRQKVYVIACNYRQLYRVSMDAIVIEKLNTYCIYFKDGNMPGTQTSIIKSISEETALDELMTMVGINTLEILKITELEVDIYE